MNIYLKVSIILAVLALALLIGFSVPVFAQDSPPDLPDTAVGFGQMLVALVMAWVGGGTIGSFLTNLLKDLLPFLKDEQRSDLTRTLTEFIATALTIGVGVAFEYSLPYLTFLDEAKIWPIILAIFGAAPAALVGRYYYKLAK